MLSVNYGNFLRRADTEKAKYEYNRPIISFVATAICVFCFTGALVSGAALGYAYMTKPVPTFSTDIFNRAQTLNTNLSRGVAQMKQSRPEGINTVNVIYKITDSKPADVSITNLKLAPGHYTIKGFAATQESANNFASSLDFGKTMQSAITSLSSDKGTNEFTIEVTAKPKAQPKAPAANANAQAQSVKEAGK